MRTWYTMLSRTQRSVLFGTLVVAGLLMIAGFRRQPSEGADNGATFTVDQGIRDIAPQLEVTGMALAHELGLELGEGPGGGGGPGSPMAAPLRARGVTQAQLNAAVGRIRDHAPTDAKYFVFVALCLVGLVFLTVLGRPATVTDQRSRTTCPQAFYTATLVVTVVLAGFLLGKSPNPMEGIVKVLKAMVGLYPSVTDKVLVLALFVALAVVGNKIICGWACPFGALQELAYKLPVLRKAKGRKLPFWLTNSIRTALFVIVLLALFGVVGGMRGTVLYHFVNPFNLFGLKFESPSILVAVIVFLGAGLLFYRPFCQFICPFGLVSWLAERVSLFRVRVNNERCIDCGACARACPSQAALGKVKQQIFSADCFSCARCLPVCPVGALTYAHKKASAPDED